jgi:hypothetical protein
MNCRNGLIRVEGELYQFRKLKLGHFGIGMSLYHRFCLQQFCSSLFDFFWLVPGFIEFDKILQ